MLPDPLLWSRIEAFELDVEGAKLPFCARLARDNGWTAEFALRVALEYKRFLYLACVAGHAVTPSDEVDQAWHLHLTYSRSYWDELCANVLQRPLHHEPTRGGAGEGQKFENWYERTLDSYREIFESEPPREVWLPSEVRFGEAPHFRRINAKRFWLVPKPRFVRSRFRFPRVEAFKLAPLVFAGILAGCSELQSVGPNVFDWHGGAFLAFFWTLIAFGLPLGWWLKNQSLRPRDANFPTTALDGYQVARLRDKNHLAVDVALAVLHQKGLIAVTPNGTLSPTEMPQAATLHPFETAVLSRVGEETTVLAARRLLSSEMASIDRGLRDMGLLVSEEIRKTADNWPLGITFSLLLIGFIKIGVGVSRDRPVGFLLMSCAVLVGFFVYFWTHSARLSGRGELLLQRISAHNNPRGQAPNDFEALSISFALAGMASYPPKMQRAMRPPSSSSDGGGSGCSSSGGDSGGGDGGGGGGCGGCGGGD